MWIQNVDAKWKLEFDRFMIFAGLVSPLATIPQIIKLYATHTELAEGVFTSSGSPAMRRTRSASIIALSAKAAPLSR